ncbi:hypothetical protein MVEN_00628500 [Mycena venus]|uniref:Uncharacterized protein n=1 Tax=Mycena venus TaxID=2733690 RepID=A0A8H7D8I2_9AGAR|nr:hypothetical protein MVEN_00628500 [Mycena venus]
MHPAVQMKSLERLPFSIRRIASLACHSTTSLEILERVKDSMASTNLSPAQRIAFLPVFLSHLDPAQIPTPEQLERFHPEIRVTIELDDWEDGGHRQACRPYTGLCLTELSHPKLVVRERAFIRFLVHADYEKYLRSICAKQVTFMAENPTCTLLLTLLNYGKGSVEIEVHSAIDSPLAVALWDWDPEWQDMVVRAMQSDGKLQLHIVQVYHGPRIQRWAVPLRCDSSAIVRGLRKLALTLPTDHTEEQVIEGIDSIRRAHPNVTEIH